MRTLITTSVAHVLGILIVVMTVFLCYRYADRLLRRLGDVGTVIVSRLMAFILLCIGVQILWNGLSGLVATLRFAAVAIAGLACGPDAAIIEGLPLAGFPVGQRVKCRMPV